MGRGAVHGWNKDDEEWQREGGRGGGLARSEQSSRIEGEGYGEKYECFTGRMGDAVLGSEERGGNTCIQKWRIRASTGRDRKSGKDTAVSRAVDGGYGEVGLR